MVDDGSTMWDLSPEFVGSRHFGHLDLVMADSALIDQAWMPHRSTDLISKTTEAPLLGASKAQIVSSYERMAD